MITILGLFSPLSYHLLKNYMYTCVWVTLNLLNFQSGQERFCFGCFDTFNNKMTTTVLLRKG